MAYRTQISGRIEIEPPIPWGDIQDSEFLPRSEDDALKYCIELDIAERDVTVREGVLRARAAIAIQTVDPNLALRAYGLLDEVQEIIDQHGDGRTFTGVLWCRGDDAHDLWQLRVVDGKAVRVEPIWPPMSIPAAPAHAQDVAP
ncbi:DUF6205 family protein [Nonomuraea sp. NPDC059023]|uniref:DUF6205 family protein n=1 Tax=unclassified Nonomuraea TaxID=2593643 RepID=UPI00368CBA76